jgi:deoxyribodipyrimidine photo-lyase
MKIGIYIFRRDLRIQDNLGLNQLQNEVDLIIPIFILDIYQIKKSSHNKYYFSNNAVQFMCESLIDLNKNLLNYDSYLRLYYGNPKKIINKLIKWTILYFKSDPSKIYLSFNADYSKYSIIRDNIIKSQCLKHKINFFAAENDYTLIPFAQLIKSDGNGFKQFGAFYKNAIKHNVNKPIRSNYSNYLNYQIKTKSEYDIDRLDAFYIINDNIAQNGGRSNAYKKLKKLSDFESYNELRNRLDYQTTNLSAYLNFGCISIREVYYLTKLTLGNTSQILKQLYWRDFNLQALKYLPDGNEFFHMDKRYEKIKWVKEPTSKQLWNILMNSKTGFLIIDAAIQELKITGFMHNRARMIVGVFWTKFLLINIFDNKYGSQVGYSKYLVDAVGPAQNKINHQWITEFDFPGKKYAPSLAPIAGRPMDPSNRMIIKFDPECIYIKKWLPHMKDIPNKELIKWSLINSNKYNNIHPPPMFDYKIKYKEWIDACIL